MEIKLKQKFIKGHLCIFFLMEIVSDQQIKRFISETKLIDKNFKPILRERKVCFEFHHEVVGEEGNVYRLIVKQSKINPLDFSIIFGVVIGGKMFRLRRYNGDSHEHTNPISREKIDGFHIHKATQEYQENGFREDAFAVKTSKFSDWKTALNLMIKENNFLPQVEEGQRRL